MLNWSDPLKWAEELYTQLFFCSVNFAGRYTHPAGLCVVSLESLTNVDFHVKHISSNYAFSGELRRFKNVNVSRRDEIVNDSLTGFTFYDRREFLDCLNQLFWQNF